MSTPAHRVPFDAPASAVPYDKKISASSLRKVKGFSSFLKETTSIPKVRLCAWGTPCRRHISCDRCADERSTELRKEWLEHIEDSDAALFVRLSTSTSHDLNVGWSNLSRTRSRFLKRYRLSALSRSWLRASEVALTGAWNWHDNFLILGTPAELDHIAGTIAEAWAEAATAVGVDASPGAQYVKRARSPRAVIKYVYKGILGFSNDSKRGRTPGDIYLGHFRGDADDGERRYELEKFFASRAKAPTLTQRGGAFRGL